MTLRLFVYLGALCGGWAGLIGWALGAWLAPIHDDGAGLVRAGVQGLFLGLAIAFGLGLLDSLWNDASRQFAVVAPRVGVSALVGLGGGLLGAALGQFLYQSTEWSLVFLFGWTIVGLLIGASIGLFDVALAFRNDRDRPSAYRKLIRCAAGGTLGGLLGGAIALSLRAATATITDKDVEKLSSPTAIGCIALGACVGLLVGLAQVVLKEAWIKIEAGFRPGRELILAKSRVTIGRAEGNDIGLFGDAAVEKSHACILEDKGSFFIVDANTAGGTFVNDLPVRGRHPLRNRDLIRLGKSLLRFHERPKKAST